MMKLELKTKLMFFILAFVFLLYGNTIRNNYALDDNYVTVTDPAVRQESRIAKGIRGIPKLFRTHYVDLEQQKFEYRPLVLTSFAIEYEFFKSDPHVSHFINVLLYAITCLVVFRVLCRILSRYNIIMPFAITLLFIVHPIHSEVVASIKNRDEIFAFMFGMLSLGFVLRALDRSFKANIVMASVCYFLAMLSKNSALLFLALIPLTLYFFTEVKPKRIILIALCLFVGLVGERAMKLGLLDADSAMRQFAFFENPLVYEKGLWPRIIMASATMAFYIKVMVLPYPLSCYYGYNTISGTDSLTVFSAIGVVVLAIFVFYAFRGFVRKTLLSYGIILFLLGLVAFANLVTPMPGIVADRFVYFASFGFCIMVVTVLGSVMKADFSPGKLDFKGKMRPFSILVLVIIVVFSGVTQSRNRDWKDELTLFRNDVKQYGASCNLQYILANKLYAEVLKTSDPAKRKTLIDEARNHYQLAAELMIAGVKDYPQDHTTLNNIGTIYADVLNNPVAAIPFFRQALRTDSANEITQYNYAYCYEKSEKTDTAISLYRKYVENETGYLPVYVRLHDLLTAKKLYQEAVQVDTKAIERSPQEPRLYVNLGNSYMLCHDTISGIEQFEKAVKLNPENTMLRDQVVTMLKSIGRNSEVQKLIAQ